MPRTPGSHSTRRPTADVRQRAWNSIRVLKRFTAVDLAATAAIGPFNLRKYLKALARAGVIVVAVPKRNGHAGGHVVWRLARDLGPLHPLPRRDGSGVYDPNRDRLHPYAEAADDRAAARPGVADRAP
ncbi:MAG: hypothetical protein P9F75_07470 [Candidatus Contendobacter sp.]|nr:hypothetical protein [Candidatus Contendobacter sp.]